MPRHGLPIHKGVKVRTSALNLTSPTDLLAVVPFILGFHPTNSLVVLCLRDRRLGLTQRLDLPNVEHANHAVTALLPSLLAERSESVILLGYEDRPGDALPALEALTSGLGQRHIAIH